jgi:hypothetical protein
MFVPFKKSFSLASCAQMKSSIPDPNWTPSFPPQFYEDEKQKSMTHLSQLPSSSATNAQNLPEGAPGGNNLLLHSFFNLLMTHYCSSSFFKSLFSSFQRIFITLFANFWIGLDSPDAPIIDIREYSDPIIEGIALVALETLNFEKNGEILDDEAILKEQAEKILNMYPIGTSLFKIMNNKLFMKQLYYTTLNDVILILFPELAK